MNFVDPFIRKRYRFAGMATIVERDAPGFEVITTTAQGAFPAVLVRLRTPIAIAPSARQSQMLPEIDAVPWGGRRQRWPTQRR